ATLTTRAEQDRAHRHAVRVLPLGRDRRTLRRGRGEAAVRVRSLLAALRIPRTSLPVEHALDGRIVVALPPHGAVRLQRNVGEDRVALDGRHRVRVGLAAGARGDAEETRLRIDRVQTTVGAGTQPGDVVT